MRRLVTLFALSMIVAGCGSQAVQVADPVDAMQMNAELAGRDVRIVLRDGTRIDAELVSAGADTSVFNEKDSGITRSIPTSAVKVIGIRTPRRGLLFGSAVGAALVGSVVFMTAADSALSGAALALGLPVGGAIGALGGLLYSWRSYRIDASLAEVPEDSLQGESGESVDIRESGVATPPN